MPYQVLAALYLGDLLFIRPGEFEESFAIGWRDVVGNSSKFMLSSYCATLFTTRHIRSVPVEIGVRRSGKLWGI
jgi:hypothetical protein